MKTHTVAIIGLGRMGSTIDDEGHGDVPYSVAAATTAARLRLKRQNAHRPTPKAQGRHANARYTILHVKGWTA